MSRSAYDVLTRRFRPLVDLDRYQLLSEKGDPGGYPPLDDDGLVPLEFLPLLGASGSVSGIAVPCGCRFVWSSVSQVTLLPSGLDDKASLPVIEPGGAWFVLEVTAPLAFILPAHLDEPGEAGETGYELFIQANASGRYRPRIVVSGNAPAYDSTYPFSSGPLHFISNSQGAGSADIARFDHAIDGWVQYRIANTPGAGVNVLTTSSITEQEVHLERAAPNRNGCQVGIFVHASNSDATSGQSARFYFKHSTENTNDSWLSWQVGGTAYSGLAEDRFSIVLHSGAQNSVKAGWGTATGIRSATVAVTGFNLGITWGQSLSVSALEGGGGGSGGYSDPLTTKGDLLARTSSVTTRLGVGSDGQILTVDAAQPTGIKWADPSGGTGSGSVTSVSAGTDLTATPSPITGAGSIAHADSGVSAGTYSSVTVNARGHVTAGSNPTVDAGTIDGLDSSQFLRKDYPNVGVTGSIELVTGSGIIVRSGVPATFQGPVEMHGADYIQLPEAPTSIFGAGPGSLLDADLLDEREGTEYAILAGQTGGQHLNGGTASGDDLTLESTAHAAKGTVNLQPSGGNVGIGNSAPSATLEVSAASDPTLRISEGGSTTSYSQLADTSVNRLEVKKVTNSGATVIDVEPTPADGVSAAQVRLFRSVNTSGLVNLAVYKGDNTPNANAVIAGWGDTYLAANNGSCGIGTASPSSAHKLDVAGASRFSSYLATAEIAAPGTPPGGFGRWYVSTTGLPRFINDAGVDVDLSSGSSTVSDTAPPYGCKLTRNTAAQLQLVPSGIDGKARLVLWDGTSLKAYAVTTTQTADKTVAGANGLDTGTAAASTFLHLWAIGKSDGTFGLLLSLSGSAPTLPSGYTFKRLLSGCPLDASVNFISFDHAKDGWIRYRGGSFEGDGVLVLNNFSSTTATAVDLTPAVPNVQGVEYGVNYRATNTNSSAGQGSSFAIGYTSTIVAGGIYLHRSTVGGSVWAQGETHFAGPLVLNAALTAALYAKWLDALGTRNALIVVIGFNLGLSW